MNNRFRAFFNFLIRNNKLRTFLFFFTISFLLWFLSGLGKSYQYTLKMPVVYTNLPSQYYKGFLPKDTLKIDIKTSGFQLLKIKLLQPVFKIDIQKTKLLDKQKLSTFDFLQQIKNELGQQVRVLKIEPQTLSFKISAVHKKQVPVVPNVTYKLKQGFKNKKQPVIIPDSIWIYGPASVIDTIKQVETLQYDLGIIHKNIHKKLKIKKTDKVKYNVEEVLFKLQVNEIVESNITLDIQIKDTLKNGKLLLFPNKLLLKYKVLKENYKPFTSNDFKVIVRLDTSENYLSPQLTKSPSGTFDFYFEPDKISYLIKKD